MNPFDLDKFLPYQLAVLSNRVSEGFSTLYSKKFGISVAEWRVVAHLSQTEKVSVREIHKRAVMEKSKVSRAAARLEKSGYISKTANPDDGRLVSLSLTEKGRAMMRELAPLAMAYEAAVLQELGVDADAFQRALGNLFAKDQFRL